MTPSLNQGPFLEATLRSVLLQGYPDLEYIVVDGGSVDGSLETIKKYSPWLASWVSEPDRGQYDAVRKGLERASGSVLAWLNSDDMYVLDSLWSVGEIFSAHAKTVEWITGLPSVWDESGRLVATHVPPPLDRRLIRGGYLEGRGLGFIQQESTFWTRRLWEPVGGRFHPEMRLAADFELWYRFAARARLYSVMRMLAGFRRRAGQRSEDRSAYFAEIDQHLGAQLLAARTRKALGAVAERQVLRAFLRFAGPPKTITYDTSIAGWRLAGE